MATAVKPAVEAVVRSGPNFKVGLKKVYLPKYVITLIENNKHPPNFATFTVPLHFNKLDLRDYLYHLYGVEVLKVRSWLIQQPPRRVYLGPMGSQRSYGGTTRPPPEKRMIVELVKPFTFPAPPEDRTPWDGLMHDRLQKEVKKNRARREEQAENHFPLPDELAPDTARVMLAKEARKLVLGEKKWNNGVELDEKWESVRGQAQGKPPTTTVSPL